MKVLLCIAKPIHRLSGFVFAMVMAAGINISFADSATNEQALTVAFLYNFLKFAEWPVGAVTGDLKLCVTDSTTFGQELDAIAGRPAQNKSVVIKPLNCVKIRVSVNCCFCYWRKSC